MSNHDAKQVAQQPLAVDVGADAPPRLKRGVMQPENVHMSDPTSDSRTVPALESQLESLAESHPLLAANLKSAQINRAERLAHYKAGVRLKGYENLLSYLDSSINAVATTDLNRLAFLLRRAHGDYVVALEAMLSGLHTMAHAAMRDVMEIEFLFREFAHDPSTIDEWLTCNQKTRYSKFRPAILRERHAERIGKKASDMSEATDYKAHSVFIHVNPYKNPFGEWGITVAGNPFAYDSCFWEMLEHARRLFLQFESLVKRVCPSARIGTIGDDDCLQEFRIAWERIQDWQALFYSLMQTAASNADEVEDA